jgi:hypothetical protein
MPDRALLWRAPNGSSGAACQTAIVADRDASDPKAWTVLHFSLSNPAGEGQGDVAALLRRVAETIDRYGDIDVQDVTFHCEVTDGEDDLKMTVYYHDRPRHR